MQQNRSSVRPKKHLGQHFLKDEAVAQRIAEAIKSSEANLILEIGPGTGALTLPLIERFGQRVLAIDVDTESIAHLAANAWIEKGQIQEGDFLKLNPEEINTPSPWVIAGNFPYNISSQILFKLLDWKADCVELVGMFQKEVAERVCAQHGSKTYGILSVLIQNYFDAEYLFTVPPHVFLPPPKVQSGVIRLIRKDFNDKPVPYSHLKRVTKAAFNQRRKTLRNALKSASLDIQHVQEDWLTKRAEQLSPAEFMSLANSIPQ